jgi:hypothetical protein
MPSVWSGSDADIASAKRETAWRRSSLSAICVRDAVFLLRLLCSEAVKQTSAAGFRQTRLIAANRRVS